MAPADCNQRLKLIVIFALMVGSLLLTQAAQAAPQGTVKLPAASLKKVKGVQCGYLLVKRSIDPQLRGTFSWVPGTLRANRLFTSDLDNSRHFDQLFKRTKEKRYKGLAASYLSHHNKNIKSCRGVVKFKSFAGKAGIGTINLSSRNRSRFLRSKGTRDSGAPLGVSSNVRVLDSELGLSEALKSGAMKGRWIFVGPGGRVFIWFGNQTDPATGLTLDFGKGGCMLMEVSADDGGLSCVDDEINMLRGTNWDSTFSSGQGDSAVPPLSFDDSGTVYYISEPINVGHRWLRKSKDGVATALVGNSEGSSAAFPRAFCVTSAGDVLVSGDWGLPGQGLRMVSPSGSISPILSSQPSSFFIQMPDGSLRFDLGGQLVSYTHGDSTFTSLGFPSSGTIHKVYRLSDGRVLVWIGDSIKQYWPSLASVPTGVSTIFQVAPVGSDLLIFGRDSSNAVALVRHDLSTGEETSVLGPMSASVDELTYIYPIAGSRIVLFTGLRYSDNSEVIGQLNIDTGAVTLEPLSESLQTFQAFGL